LHVTQSSSSQVKYCQYCGKELPIEASFCLNCGKPTQMPLPLRYKTTFRRLVYFSILCLIFAFGLLIGFFRNPVIFFLGMLGIFGNIVVILHELLVVGKKPFCPKCNKNLASYPSDIRRCPYCANVLARSFKKFCVYCGSGMASDGTFCPNCGKGQLKPEVGRSIG